MSDADILIAGGGPIGLAVAIEARLAGLSAMVVEPRENAIDKACGEGLMPGAVAALDRLGVWPDGFQIAGVAYVNRARRVEHRFGAGSALGVRRPTLHAAMLARALELGVRRVAGKVDALEQSNGEVRAFGQFGMLSAPWLAGCDGLHSTVRRLVGVEAPARSARTRRYGIRRHYRVEPWSQLIEVHWAPGVEAYVTPVADNEVGIAILGPRHAEFAAALATIPDLAGRVRDAQTASSLRGAGPLRQRTVRRTAGRVLLAGDASGYVDALTGEGLRVGLSQARALIASVLAGEPAKYERAWSSGTRDFRMITAGLVAVARSPLRQGIVPTAAALPGVFGSIVERLAR